MPNTISPNMNLVIPGVGTEAGPQWATDLNNSLIIIDQHDHTPGSGVQITPAGLNISSDLSLQGNNLAASRSLRLNSQSAVLSLPADLRCLYSVGVDLYFNDGNGNHIQITQSGGIAGSPGSISNLTSPASASYVSANSTFVWQSAANTPANMDNASIILRNLTANSKGLTLAPPAAMGADTTITLPSLPGATSFLTMDSSGNISASPALPLTRANMSLTSMTMTILNVGSGTYTTPTSPFIPLYLKIRMVGAGAGGCGSNNSSSSGGGNTSFGTLTAFGGIGISGTNNGGSHGGTGAVSGAFVGTAIQGGSGTASSPVPGSAGGAGGNSAFGGGGGGGNVSVAGDNGSPNSGAGGGGGGGQTSVTSGGGGGGAGGYLEAVTLGALAATYSYSVGVGGAGSAHGAGTGGNGGNGADGLIIIEEHYQ